MPFDATGFRPPKVTVLPPTLREPSHDARLPPVVPERRGGEPPRRVHIIIEIEDRRRPPVRRRGGILWWIVAFGLIALAAHAQPVEWHSYPFGSGTNYTGTDQQGRDCWGAALAFTRIARRVDAAGRDRPAVPNVPRFVRHASDINETGAAETVCGLGICPEQSQHGSRSWSP